MKTLWILAVAVIAVGGCSREEKRVAEETPPEERERPVVYATNYPLAYFAERIAGPVVEVRTLAPAGEDPADWRPRPEDVLAMQEAELIVLNGASYEKWLEGVSLPPSRLVVTTDALRDRLIPLEGRTTHSHGPEGEHEHSGTAFTTWLDPTLAAAQAAAIESALAARWPGHTGRFKERMADLGEDLAALDARTREALAGNRVPPVLFSHPVYQYFVRRYDLDARSVHWEPDRMPDEAGWRELEAILAEYPASWMIWEATPLPETRDRLESAGVRSAVFDPCATRPPSGDFLSIMKGNVETLRRVFALDGTP